MIDEYAPNYFILSCDICGITEDGPFETFSDAVDYKRENPSEWKSLFLKSIEDGKFKWHDVCAGCVPKTSIGNLKLIPESKREHPLKTEKVDEGLTNMANQIAKTIMKRARNL